MVVKRNTRVVVIDDSAYNRRTLSAFLDEEPDITVVAKACDGEEGLEVALREKPDVITLDLEMPRMGGFAFLRILMARRPTPVIVISSHKQAENVFRALDLGALDFVAKPTKRVSPEIKQIKEEVISKVRLARTLKKDSIHPLPDAMLFSTPPLDIKGALPNNKSLKDNMGKDEPTTNRVVAIAASTGGPAALTQVLCALPRDLNAAIVVVQHMPPRFTTTFAERLNQKSRLRVKEVTGMDPLRPGWAYIAPGHACLEVGRSDGEMNVMAVPPDGTERYVPSADRLFSSVAFSAGKQALGIVLTGMGDDGSRGAVDLAANGAAIVVEDKSTTVVDGMPSATLATGTVTRVAPLPRMAGIITKFAASE